MKMPVDRLFFRLTGIFHMGLTGPAGAVSFALYPKTPRCTCAVRFFFTYT